MARKAAIAKGNRYSMYSHKPGISNEPETKQAFTVMAMVSGTTIRLISALESRSLA